MTTFHKEQLKFSRIILINTFNVTKWNVLYICANTVSRKMKGFLKRENSPQQIIVFPMKAIKRLQKNGTIQLIKHVFVRVIVYKQGVANMNVRIH